jgi:hypothetical protein
MGQTVTRILTKNDLLVSEEFAPPFRIDYYAFTETANSSLDILVVEKKSYDDFIGRGIEPVYIQGLSSVAVPSAKVRGMVFVHSLVISLSQTLHYFDSFFLSFSFSLFLFFFFCLSLFWILSSLLSSR